MAEYSCIKCTSCKIYFKPTLSVNSCPIFVVFLEPRYSWQSIVVTPCTALPTYCSPQLFMCATSQIAKTSDCVAMISAPRFLKNLQIIVSTVLQSIPALGSIVLLISLVLCILIIMSPNSFLASFPGLPFFFIYFFFTFWFIFTIIHGTRRASTVSL